MRCLRRTTGRRESVQIFAHIDSTYILDVMQLQADAFALSTAYRTQSLRYQTICMSTDTMLHMRF
jgi:hypothetical protein